MKTCQWNLEPPPAQRGTAVPVLPSSWFTTCGWEMVAHDPDEAEGFVYCPNCGSTIEQARRWWRVKIIETRYHYVDVPADNEAAAENVVGMRVNNHEGSREMRLTGAHTGNDDFELVVSETNSITTEELHS